MTFFRYLALALSLTFSLFAHAGPKEDIQADMAAGRWQQADSRLATVLEEHPQNPLAHYWRAQTQAKLGNLAGARASLDAAKRIDPSLKFASNPGVLASLEKRTAAVALPQPATPSQDALPRSLELEVQPAAANLLPYAGVLAAGILVIGIIGAGIVALLTYWDNRDSEKARQRQQHGDLQEAERDLSDALVVSDTNPDITPEVRLANHARITRALQEVRGQLGTLKTAKGPFEVGAVVGRAHNIAAEVRGEETPAARRDRLRAEEVERQEKYRLDNLNTRTASPSNVNEASPAYARSSSSGTDMALLGGLAIGSMASSRPAAASPATDDSFAVDFGSTSSSNDVDTGGSVGAGDSSFS